MKETGPGAEKRRHERTPLCARIRITHESFGSRIVKIRDISLGGVFLLVEDLQMPPEGTVIEGQVQDDYMERPVVKMEVVRLEPSGVGLKFVD
ncbi:MAG TPA: PilZ domain-containing protein [Sedimenticola thiotaurini]|uniref:PilZ domain-containing protein n=1 Tax=Sedimenticola thiotaurini TaxID=1543721 RepID=A0A831RLI8_9GAMM|nr:PilZ domain-containing protein [Sedimenticola thiotaurini]